MAVGGGGPLAGLRVIDATQMLAGPLCGMRLGDLGAEVLKVEQPDGGEHNRRAGFPGGAVSGENTNFLGLNRNKRSVALDLKHPGGVQALHDLVRVSDVFIQNYRVGTAERIGAGYEQLTAVNPRLVYCSISGYGETGPYAHRPGQDLIVQGYSGSMWAVGSDGDAPQPGGLWAVDAMTGYQAAIGILSALHARHRTGRGQKVEVNMLAVVMDSQAQELTTYLNTGLLPERPTRPSAHPWIPGPYGVFPTSDGWMTLAMPSLPLLGEALDDDRLRSMTSPSDATAQAELVHDIVTEITPSRSTAEWLGRLDALRIWCGPVYDYAALERDPHVVATGMLIAVDHPTLGTLRLPGVPLTLSDTPCPPPSAPPLLGEHTADVLRTWARYDDRRVADLAHSGAIGSAVAPQTETERVPA